jgi:hypothetical protein
MTTTIHEGPTDHPIAWFTAQVHGVLDRLADTPAWSLTPEEQRSVLAGLARAEARIHEVRLRVLAAADAADAGADAGATSTAAWVAHETRQVRSAAHADVHLARELAATCPTTRQALGEGRVNAAQARVIVRAMESLPDTITAADRERAERHLVQAAGDHDAKALAVLGRRVFEVIDPEAADLEEGRRLEAEERAAARATYLHLSDNGDGTCSGRFKIPTLHAAMLRKALQAITAPRVQAQDPTRHSAQERPGSPEQQGRALCRLLERFPAQRLPQNAGLSATVVVLLDYDKLLSGLGAATLDSGEVISASRARTMACEAGVVPVVYRRLLAGRPMVLDVGRRRRFHDQYQRLGLMVQDGGCSAVGCDRPPGWTEAHHDQVSWQDGGGTSVAKGRLLCAFHHHRAHDPTYDATRRADGKIEFHRRT